MRRVLLLVELTSSVGRGLTSGVWRSKRGSGQWQLEREDDLYGDYCRSAIESFHGDGIIARVRSADMVKLLRAKKVPVVDVLGTVREAGFPVVACDDRAIGREGARHLLDVGHGRFAFVEVKNEQWATERRAGFEAALAPRRVSVLDVSWDEVDSAEPSERVVRFMSALPRPIGLMACSDRMGTLLTELSTSLGLSVPEAVSIVGVDNDEMYCTMSDVPLSSVKTDHARIGYEAAELLDRLMRGEAAPKRPLLIAPDGVVVRGPRRRAFDEKRRRSARLDASNWSFGRTRRWTHNVSSSTFGTI